jgi:tRNA(Ile)-lysidine synthetase-like protein
MRIARGTGVRGLRGIAERRGRLVRPLLVFDRAAIDEYLARERLAWREDPTNADVRFTRNRVRAALMPALGRDATGALASVAVHAGVLEASLRRPLEGALAEVARPTERGFAIARAALRGYDPAARARLLRELASRLGVTPTRAATEAALALAEGGASGSGIDLGGGVRLERELSDLRLERAAAAPLEDRPLRIDSETGSGRVVVGGRALAVEWAPMGVVAPGEAPADARAVLVGAARLPLELRPWQPGDRMRLHAGSRKLKKLFNDWRIERPERVRVPVLADASGRILWVAGRVAAVDAATAGEPLLRISVSDAELE